MIHFYNQINFIDLMYMQKKYGQVCNEATIATLFAWKLKKLFASEDKDLVLAYKLNVINKYIRLNYEHTIEFLNSLKRILRRLRIELNDLNNQELLLLEERVFSTNRNIKVLATNIETSKNERIGIKFIRARLFKIIDNRFVLLGFGELFISNKRVIFITNQRSFIFKWSEVKDYQYDRNGFMFQHRNHNLTLTIHDNLTLNSTINNYLIKINFRLQK